MKSIASSIQPSLAAARTRHCSRVIVRYHGADAAVAVAEIEGGVTGTLLRLLRADPIRAAPLMRQSRPGPGWSSPAATRRPVLAHVHQSPTPARGPDLQREHRH